MASENVYGPARDAKRPDARERRERLRKQFPIAARMLKDPAVAHSFIATAPMARMLIKSGISPSPDMGVENFDACIAILKDGLGIVPLSDGEFELAMRLATPPECRETGQ